MNFLNHTPFPALAFQGRTPEDEEFHVVVLRQTLTLAQGTLVFAEEQTPICEEDT